jgi:glycosyltransferase involved in cell wall biosynthesis
VSVGSRLLIASDVRVVRTPSGGAMATHPAGELAAFLPLRDACGPVTVISRDASGSPDRPEAGGPLTGQGVTHVGVPDYVSWRTLLRALPRTLVTVWRSVGRHDAVWVRLPEPLSVLVGLMARVRRRRLVVNLVADPSSLVLPGSARPVRPVLSFLVRTIVRKAAGVVYVTGGELQRRYPPALDVPTLLRSNVLLTSVATSPRDRPPSGRVRLVTVGTNSRLSKGQDLVLDAVRELADRGVDVSADLVGGGDRTQWLGRRAAELGIAERCRVRGHVADLSDVQTAYAAADVFCLPSRSEGLPRAMIEAMATGLPCVGSDAGGIPALLPPAQVVVGPNGSNLADAVLRLLQEPGVYERASTEALRTAEEVRRSTRPELLRDFLSTVLAPA